MHFRSPPHVTARVVGRVVSVSSDRARTRRVSGAFPVGSARRRVCRRPRRSTSSGRARTGRVFRCHFRSRPSITRDRGRRVTARAARGRTLPSRRRALTRRVSGASCASPPRVPAWVVFAPFGVVGSALTRRAFRSRPRVPACVVIRVVRRRRIGPYGASLSGAFPVASARHRASGRPRRSASSDRVLTGEFSGAFPVASARHRACRRSRRSASSDRALARRVLRCISGHRDPEKVELAQVHGRLTSSSLRFAGASYLGHIACQLVNH